MEVWQLGLTLKTAWSLTLLLDQHQLTTMKGPVQYYHKSTICYNCIINRFIEWLWTAKRTSELKFQSFWRIFWKRSKVKLNSEMTNVLGNETENRCNLSSKVSGDGVRTSKSRMGTRLIDCCFISSGNNAHNRSETVVTMVMVTTATQWLSWLAKATERLPWWRVGLPWWPMVVMTTDRIAWNWFRGNERYKIENGTNWQQLDDVMWTKRWVTVRLLVRNKIDFVSDTRLQPTHTT